VLLVTKEAAVGAVPVYCAALADVVAIMRLRSAAADETANLVASPFMTFSPPENTESRSLHPQREGSFTAWHLSRATHGAEVLEVPDEAISAQLKELRAATDAYPAPPVDAESYLLAVGQRIARSCRTSIGSAGPKLVLRSPAAASAAAGRIDPSYRPRSWAFWARSAAARRAASAA
jgi:hypothetical protein